MSRVKTHSAVFLVTTTFLYCDAQAATHIWVSYNGDFASPTSWSTGIGPSGWGPKDRVLFDGQFGSSVQSGFDQSSVIISELEFDDSYWGDVGVEDSPLSIKAATVRFRGQGQFHFHAPEDTGVFNTVLINDTYTYGTDTLSGWIAYLVVRSGIVAIRPQSHVGMLLVAPNEQYNGVHVTIAPPGPSLEKIAITAGDLDNYRDIAPEHRVIVTGGNLRQWGRFLPGSEIIQSGGVLLYEPLLEPASNDGPVAELYGGVTDFSQSLYDVMFRFGFVSPRAMFIGNLSTQEMGLVELNATRPEFDVWLRGDSDADAVFDLFDECADTPVGVAVDQHGAPLGDTDGDCRITLKDFATMQNAMTGP